MTKRIRVYELAKDLKVDSKVVIAALNEMGLPIKNHMAALDDRVRQAVARKITEVDKAPPQKERSVSSTTTRAGQSPAQATTEKPQQQARGSRPQSRGGRPPRGGQGRRPRGKGKSRQSPGVEAGARRVVIQGPTPVRELASLVGMPVANVLRTLMGMGTLISINQSVPPELAAKVAEKLGCVVTIKEPEMTKEELIAKELERPDNPDVSVPRPPVVTVMGHVDHGKTSLLDAMRNTNITQREAGGITQHIGASVVEWEGSRIIFLDTPGHEAFTSMRARGAQATDVAVLVVAADDGVMPQTVEAINHAKAAGVPIVVALNKMDKPGVKPDRVKQQLVDAGQIPEEWGGDTIVVEVSARTGQGLDTLLEMILLVAEMQEIKTDPTRKARGIIIESLMDKGRGPVATAIIKSGILQVGDVLITDTTWGRIRAMHDARGKRVSKAGPATPVEIVGMEGLPQAGDQFLVVEDEKMARDISQQRKDERRAEELGGASRMTLEELFEKKSEEEKRQLKLIVKSDVQGSLEAIVQALRKIEGGEVELVLIHSGVGGITESDVMLAAASEARILGFNTRPVGNAQSLADADRVQIRTYRVIYDLLDDIESVLKGLVKPKIEEVVLGRAEIRRTFQVPRMGTVAGCYVVDGKIARSAKARLLRDGIIVYEGQMASLRRFKDDVSEVTQGYECGIGLDRFQDIKPGDIIEAFTVREVRPA